MIPAAVIDRTREATDIVELISGYLRLKKRGGNFVGLCPFHAEKTPSFNVNSARQIYHCFGCGRGGDVFKFLMEHERMSFTEAVTLLAERAHIEIPRTSGRTDDPTDRIYRAHAVALEYFHKALAHPEVGEPARAYLDGRAIDARAVESFGLGYAPDRLRGLCRYAERQGISVPDLERAGLVYTDGARVRDRFSGRLIFPIRSLSGRTIAFGARDLSGRARAKYLNSPESAIYQKGRVLYGLYEARRAIQDRGDVFICEGYMDLIRLHTRGFENAVAASGTAFTPDQARLLARYAQNVRLVFDADGPGLDAALRSVAVLFDAGLDVSVVSLGGGEDPDSFLVRHGEEAFRSRVDAAVDYIEFCEQRAGGSFKSLPPGRQDRLIAEISETVRRIGDPVRRDLVTRAAWSRFGVAESFFRARLAAAGSTGPGESTPAPAEVSGPETWRRDLLGFLLATPAARAEAAALVPREAFTQPAERRLLELLLGAEGRERRADELLHAAGDPKLQRLIGELASRGVPYGGDELGDYLYALKRHRLQTEARDVLALIREAEKQGDHERVRRLSDEYHGLREEWLRLDKERRGRSSPGAGEGPGKSA